MLLKLDLSKSIYLFAGSGICIFDDSKNIAKNILDRIEGKIDNNNIDIKKDSHSPISYYRDKIENKTYIFNIYNNYYNSPKSPKNDWFDKCIKILGILIPTIGLIYQIFLGCSNDSDADHISYIKLI